MNNDTWEGVLFSHVEPTDKQWNVKHSGWSWEAAQWGKELADDLGVISGAQTVEGDNDSHKLLRFPHAQNDMNSHTRIQ